MTRRASSRRNNGKSAPGRLRIVAGKWRSRLLNIAAVPEIRPTSERIRETLFNWLAPQIQGARCLDLFAGTGVLGLEALSRGAASATFVEKSPAAVTMLNLARQELGADTAEILCRDAFEFLRLRSDQRFSLVFLDPPFADESLSELCRLLGERQWLDAGAQIYLEQEKAHASPELPERWTIVHEKTAGNVRYSLVSTPNAQSPA